MYDFQGGSDTKTLHRNIYIIVLNRILQFCKVPSDYDVNNRNTVCHSCYNNVFYPGVHACMYLTCQYSVLPDGVALQCSKS